MPPRQPAEDPWGGLAPLAIAAFAVVCCAGLPLLAAVASGVTLGAVLGVGAGAVAVVLLVGMIVVRTRRRRACAPGVPDSRRNGTESRARSRKEVR